MDATTPTACSTVTSSSISSQAPPPAPCHILEISLISAQDLAGITKSMRTYATAWIHTNRKLSTRTDHHGNTNPTWNEKLAFRVDDATLVSENVALTVEIYAVSWLRDVLVGTVNGLINDLITPSLRFSHNTRFVAFQVRRPSGSPQGILNMGIALVDNIDRKAADATLQQKDRMERSTDEDVLTNSKIQLWRSLSVGSDLADSSLNEGSICLGSSVVNGSELCSDIGPSASIVAAELARKSPPPPPANPAKKSYKASASQSMIDQETGSSILEELTIEEAKAKGYKFTSRRERWTKDLIHSGDDGATESELSAANSGRHFRRNSDGGLFSCFGNAYGIEFTIVCGASNNASTKKVMDSKSRKKKSSETNSL